MKISNYKNPYDLEFEQLKAYIAKLLDIEKYKILRKYHDSYFFGD